MIVIIKKNVLILDTCYLILTNKIVALPQILQQI